jgi:hypothetical protein
MEDIQQEILDSCLLSFMSNYEGPAGHNNWVVINCSVEEHDAVQEFKAVQVAQGWMKRNPGEGMRLTDAGYLHHLPRAKFLRAKSGQQLIATC